MVILAGINRSFVMQVSEPLNVNLIKAQISCRNTPVTAQSKTGDENSALAVLAGI